jgi:hypothetical protein
VDELEPLGKDSAVAGLDLVGDEEKKRGFFALVNGVHEDRALAHQIAVLLKNDVTDGEHERVTGMDHLGEGNAWPVEWADGFLSETCALVAFQDWGEFPAVAPSYLAVALANEGGDVSDLPAARFARIHGTAETLECLREERADEVGLQAAGVGHFHLLFHSEEPLDAHGFLRERVAFEEFLDVAAVEGGVDAVREAGANLGQVVVTDGIEQEVLEALFLEHLTKNIEYASFECFVDGFQLDEQTMIDFALAGFLGHEVPEMTDLLLANAVDAPETLFETVRIPRQVVIDHEIGVLEVHAFTGSIGGEEDTGVGVGTEQGLPFAAFVAVRAAVNCDDCVGRAEDATDFPLQIVQRVKVRC